MAPKREIRRFKVYMVETYFEHDEPRVDSLQLKFFDGSSVMLSVEELREQGAAPKRDIREFDVVRDSSGEATSVIACFNDGTVRELPLDQGNQVPHKSLINGVMLTALERRVLSLGGN